MLVPSGNRISLSGKKMMSFSGQRVDEFSKQDYSGGPGYLAAPDRLIHQNGVHDVSTVVYYRELFAP